MADLAALQGSAIHHTVRNFPEGDRLQQDPVDFVPWLKRVRRHAAKQNSLFRDGNLYINDNNKPAGTTPQYTDNPQYHSELSKMRTKQASNYVLVNEAAEGNSLAKKTIAENIDPTKYGNVNYLCQCLATAFLGHDFQCMMAIHQQTGWVARRAALSAVSTPQLSQQQQPPKKTKGRPDPHCKHCESNGDPHDHYYSTCTSTTRIGAGSGMKI